MKLISAPTRLTLGLLSLSVSVWLMAITLGLLPNPRRQKLHGRIALCEEAAVFCSLLAARNDFRLIESSLELLVANNEDIASAAMRRSDGLLLAEIGDHTAWNLPPGRTSTENQMRVPILAGTRTWGHVEIRFQEPPSGLLGRWAGNPIVALLLFAGSASYLLYFVYLRKMLKNLDPSKVIPSRIRSTLDTFAEGLLVLDSHERIVLANRAFGKAMHVDSKDLVGRAASQLPWTRNLQEAPDDLPWKRAVDSGSPQIGELLTVDEGSGRRYFKVNACPIMSDNGQRRGALASFDDVTDLENKKAELLGMLERLKESQNLVREQNRELQILATIDPLTGCRNRRALFQEFEQQWQSAVRYSQPLSCIMVDIDHFKSINDKHGHATGDEVLRSVSRILRETVRGPDIVGRYGGEEFCIVLPQLTIEQASQAADRFRQVIAELRMPQLQVTASLGVSSIEFGAGSVQELLDQADKALYVAKRNGRNRVVRWDDAPAEVADAPSHEATPGSKSAAEALAPPVDQIPYAAVASLLAALAYRDPDTAAHSTRVADLCVATARDLMSVHDAYVLEVAALLHDIGKIGVPDNILLKPGPLTREEWDVMSLHDRIGCEIVDASFNCPTLTEIVRYHHFPFSGDPRMPHGRSGLDIPLGARILTIADAFDAMVSNRIYRAGRSRKEAFGELRRCAAVQFDPDLVDHFIKTVSEGRGRGPVDSDSISRQLALQLGVQAERLAHAVDVQDFQTIRALARYLEATAAKNGVETMREIAARLQSHCDGEPDLKEIIQTTHEIVDLCRAAQRAHIDIDPELSAAPAASRRNVYQSAGGLSDRAMGARLASLLASEPA